MRRRGGGRAAHNGRLQPIRRGTAGAAATGAALYQNVYTRTSTSMCGWHAVSGLVRLVGPVCCVGKLHESVLGDLGFLAQFTQFNHGISPGDGRASQASCLVLKLPDPAIGLGLACFFGAVDIAPQNQVLRGMQRWRRRHLRRTCRECAAATLHSLQQGRCRDRGGLTAGAALAAGREFPSRSHPRCLQALRWLLLRTACRWPRGRRAGAAGRAQGACDAGRGATRNPATSTHSMPLMC